MKVQASAAQSVRYKITSKRASAENPVAQDQFTPGGATIKQLFTTGSLVGTAGMLLGTSIGKACEYTVAGFAIGTGLGAAVGVAVAYFAYSQKDAG